MGKREKDSNRLGFAAIITSTAGKGKKERKGKRGVTFSLSLLENERGKRGGGGYGSEIPSRFSLLTH